jgi:hypothetical protein
LLIFSFLPVVAHAHNLFVLLERQSNGPDRIDVIFEHAPYPGKGEHNQPLLDRGKTWVVQPDLKETQELQLQEVTRLGKKFLQTQTDTLAPRAIVHSCQWGVYNGRLDYFHGKYLDVTTSEEAKQLARTPQLPLDVVPTVESDQLTVTVLFEDEPLANTGVWVWAPGGKETKHTTDAAGKLTLRNLAPGTYSISTVHVIQGPTGEFDGQPYKGVMHGTTCNLRWPVN